MYKIVSVTDKSGNVKWDFINDMKSKHGDELLGDFVYYDIKNTLDFSHGMN